MDNLPLVGALWKDPVHLADGTPVVTEDERRALLKMFCKINSTKLKVQMGFWTRVRGPVDDAKAQLQKEGLQFVGQDRHDTVHMTCTSSGSFYGVAVTPKKGQKTT